MSGLTHSQQAIIAALIDTAPDSAIRSLDMALSADPRPTSGMAAIRDLVSREAADRADRRAVFAPLLPLCPRQPPALRRLVFPAKTPALLWRGLSLAHPGLIEDAKAAAQRLDEDALEAVREAHDALLAAAALGLREADPAFAPALKALADAGQEGAAFAACLDLAPLVRRCLPRLDAWLGRMSEDRAVEVRLAYQDAVDIAPDAGPRLLEMLFAHMPEPWTVLRLICAVSDRPTDRFAAASEVADFGLRLLDEIDRRIDEARLFDPAAGRAAGAAAGEVLHEAAMIIAEFEMSVELSRDGPWGGRIAKQKQAMAATAEARLKEVDEAVGAALPMHTVRFSGRMLRPAPRLSQDPDPRLMARAESLLTFLEQVRFTSGQAGYSAARAKVAEKVEVRLSRYVEELLEQLHAGEIDNAERAHLYLDAAARLTLIAKGEKAAQIIRRRAAVAA